MVQKLGQVSCPHHTEGRKYRRCRVWADGFLGSREIPRQSLNTRSWEEAQKKVREWESQGSSGPEPEPEPVSIKQACDSFIRDAGVRNLREPTLYKYHLLFRQLRDFALRKGLRFM